MRSGRGDLERVVTSADREVAQNLLRVEDVGSDRQSGSYRGPPRNFS